MNVDLSFQLAASQERDYGQVYEIDLHGARVSHINNLEKVRPSMRAVFKSGHGLFYWTKKQRVSAFLVQFTKVRILDLSCNCIHRIENLDKLQVMGDRPTSQKRLKLEEVLREDIDVVFASLSGCSRIEIV